MPSRLAAIEGKLDTVASDLAALTSIVRQLEEHRDEAERERVRAAIREEERERARAELGLPPAGPATVPGVHTSPAWASTVREGLDLVARPGGIAVLIALTTALAGPRFATAIEVLAEAMTADVAVDVSPVYPPAPYSSPTGDDDDSPHPPHPVP